MAFTLYSLLQNNKTDAFTGLIEDVTTYSPEALTIPAFSRPGLTYKTVSRTSLMKPVFRGQGQSIVNGTSTYDSRAHEMFFLDAPMTVDDLIVRASDGTSGDILYNEAQGALQAMFNTIGYQTWYGAPNDGSGGFVGVRTQLLPTGSGIIPVTASAAANTTSVYGLWLDSKGVSYSVGNDGEFNVNPWQRMPVYSQDASGALKSYWAWTSNVSTLIGLQIGSIQSVYAVTGVSNAAPMTDALGIKLMAQVPGVRRTGFTFFMNRLAHGTLQSSRLAIIYQPAGPSGELAVPQSPIAMEGHPIIITDNITNTENNT